MRCMLWYNILSSNSMSNEAQTKDVELFIDKCVKQYYIE